MIPRIALLQDIPTLILWILPVLLLASAPVTFAEADLGRTDRLQSEILGEDRAIRIFLPASYGALETGRYPVLYMVDGDYHFHYLSGLLEQMSSISEQIPELILVAIDDKGKTVYRHNMAPSIGEKGGNGSTFLRFIEEELIPHVESTYRTSDHRILVGQSMGGLFTVASLLEKPGLFDTFIAISPSLWWQDQALIRHAEEVFKAKPDLSTTLYLTVANERGMGVLGFADLLDRAAPPGLRWRFERHVDENHGSVGVPSLRWALREEFAGYELSAQRFYTLKGPADVVAYFKELRDRLGAEFLLPPTVFSNVLHFYQRKDRTEDIRRLEQAIRSEFPGSLAVFQLTWMAHAQGLEDWPTVERLSRDVVASHPNAWNAWAGAALAASKLGRQDEAEETIRKAIEVAKKHGARRWQLNQLRADQRQIEE